MGHVLNKFSLVKKKLLLFKTVIMYLKKFLLSLSICEHALVQDTEIFSFIFNNFIINFENKYISRVLLFITFCYRM